MKQLKTIDDLLTPEQRAELQKDLEKMAKQRRRAYDQSAQIPMASTRGLPKRRTA